MEINPGWALPLLRRRGNLPELAYEHEFNAGGSGGSPYSATTAELRFNGFLNGTGNFVTAPYAADLLSWTESSFLFGCCHGISHLMGTHPTFWSASAPNFIATVLPAFYSVAQISVTSPILCHGPKDVTVDGSK